MKKILLITTICLLLSLFSLSATAQSMAMSFPVIDQLMCGFIIYTKGKLAPYIAVLCIVISVIGHWLGMTKIWGSLLYISMGLGLIMGIGTVITSATGTSASCLSY
ncbi:MAG: hypothetical protein WCJ99_08605 [Betaproteobacteria bacterium]|jgi:type IV secretory pathway VirB2 component (pilin)